MSTSSERPKPATAKWGAACAQCATAKAKCIRSNPTPGAKCDRCERLVKDCRGQVHRPRKKRQPKPSRTAQIEQRLNGLVSLLKASGGLSSAELSTDTTCIPSEADPAVSNQQAPSKRPSGTFSPSQNPWAIPETYNSYAPPSCICRPETGDAPPPPDTDEALLDIYRNELQPVHPFIIIPDDVSAAELQAVRPFLMSAIRMVTSFRSLRSMRAQMYYLMKHLADHMLIRSERSLDLLMGILVIAAWYQYHCFMHAQLNNLIALACTLVGELGLSRNPNINERTNLMVVKPSEPLARTNEERRALAGVWYLSSSMSIGFSRIESMRYTRYIQQCVNELAEDQEYETDEKLVYLVRVQHLTERISQLNSPEDPAEEVAGLPSAPLSAYVSAFQADLDRIRNTLPESLKDDKMFLVLLNSASLRLYEPPVPDTSLIIRMSESLTSTKLGGTPALNVFYQASHALRQFFDTWLSIPVSDYYFQTAHVAAQLVYAITLLGRWAKFTAPIPLDNDPIPMPHDPSSHNPNYIHLMADSQYSASLSSRRATPSGSSPSVHGKEPRATSASEQIVPRQDLDPRLPAAVASLKAQMKAQPGLTIDVSGILSGVCSRFEEANATFQVSSAEPGVWDHNVFSMGVIKVRIARAKLERWAELVAAGTSALKINDDEDTRMPVSERTEDGEANTQGPSEFTQNDLPSVDPMNWAGGTPWTSDMFQGVDPSVWFDGYLDWGAVIMNSMGTLEQ